MVSDWNIANPPVQNVIKYVPRDCMVPTLIAKPLLRARHVALLHARFSQRVGGHAAAGKSFSSPTPETYCVAGMDDQAHLWTVGDDQNTMHICLIDAGATAEVHKVIIALFTIC
jgi:hypothetical protein